MKIAFYAGTYVKDKDGAVRTMYQLVSSFLAEGHEVMVWSPDVSPGHGRRETVNPLPSVPIPLYPDYRLGFYTASTEKQIDAFGPDIVHISTPDIIGGRFLRYAGKRGLPVATIYHTDFPSYLAYYRLGFAENAVWKYLRKFYNSCDAVFVPTEEMKIRLESQGIQRVDIWARGIDRSLFNPQRRSDTLRAEWDADGRFVIAYAGRFVWYKDIQVVIDVYKKSRESAAAAAATRFVMIGSGPEEEVMRREMPDAVFPGYLGGTALPEAYASSDLLLFPSTTEAFGNVVLEAFSSGIPAVVSDAGGCQELVRGSDAGYIAAAGDAEAFWQSCRRLLHDRSLYDEKCRKGLDFAERMSWPVINAALIARYEEIIAGKRAD